MKLKKTLSVVTATVLSCSMAFAVTGCDPKDPDGDKATITAITLNDKAEVEVGATTSVIKEITYSDGSTKKTSDSEIVWASSAEAIATVTRGIVTGNAKGSANVTATLGSITSNTCAITVIASREVTITSESIVEGKLVLDKGNNPTAQLSATVTREGTVVPDQEIVWSSADTDKVTVDATGKVTAIMDTAENTPVNVTATIKGTSIKANIPVTVTWADKANFVFDASTYEQNKSPAKIWNYWGDKDYNWTNTTIFSAYVDPTYEENHEAEEGYSYIGAEKATIEFKVDDPTKNVAAIQLFYRSAGEEGKLLTNHNYEVKLKLDSNVAGTVSLNDFTKLSGAAADGVKVGEITEGTEEEEVSYEFEIEAGVNELSVKFRHGDTGAIFANGFYENIESAIQLCLGKLAGDHVVVSVYDIQYKDLGEAENKWIDSADNIAGNEVEMPEHPEAPEVKPVTATTVTGVTLSVEDGKAIYNLAGTVDLSQYNNDVETAKTWLAATHFDLQQCTGSWTEYAFERAGVTVNADGTFLIKYDITYLGVDKGGTGAYSNHFTEKEPSEEGYGENKYRDVKLSKEQAVPGESITVGDKIYSIVNYQAGEDFESTEETEWGQAYNYGCVSIKVERVGGTETPDDTELVEGTVHEAVYADYNNDGDTLAAKDTWGIWYVADAGWDGCGEVVTMNVTLDADAKSCTIKYNANGNERNWGVQLRYLPEDVVEGQLYKVKLTINTDVAYSISLNGKPIALEVGENNVELQWTAGKYILDGSISKAGSNEDITLVISNLTWTELVPAE